jgi:hypothetical protein
MMTLIQASNRNLDYLNLKYLGLGVKRVVQQTRKSVLRCRTITACHVGLCFFSRLLAPFVGSYKRGVG